MKTIVYALPLIVTASAAFAHADSHAHTHLTDAGWLPVLAGLLTIVGAATLAWMRK